MLIHTTDSNDMVAIEACEFWLTIAEITDICKISLQPYLARLERESINTHSLYTLELYFELHVQYMYSVTGSG